MEGRTISRRTSKICSRCGLEVVLNASECRECGGKRFEPAWVRAKRPVNRQVSVQVTSSNPEFGDVRDRVTLSKWWPGGRATFHIPDVGQWETIRRIVDEELIPILGWEVSQELSKSIARQARAGREGARGLAELVDAQPDVLKKLVSAIDPKRLGRQDFTRLRETFSEISDAYSNADAGFREAFLSVVKKLPRQKQRALEDLDLLLQNWNLQVITNVAQQVRARLNTIQLLERQINDARTYELEGENSIHRILERAMWLVDERYWLLQSNRTLRTHIGSEMSKRDRQRYGAKRPDFVCGTIGQKLIILELKKPGHTLSVEDLNQLETYVVVAESYSDHRSAEAYLVGSKVDDEVRKYLKYRSQAFKTLLYSDLIDATMDRYRSFLKAMEPEAAGS